MSSGSEWREVIGLLSARVSFLEGRFGKKPNIIHPWKRFYRTSDVCFQHWEKKENRKPYPKFGNSASYVRTREEGVHNGRWRGKDADFLDLILNHLAENYPLEPLITERPQDTPWFLINEFKKCAFNTTIFKNFLFDRFRIKFALCSVITEDTNPPAVRLDKLDELLRARPTSNSGTDDVTVHKGYIEKLLKDVLFCTYLSNITHDEYKVMDVMTNQRELYENIQSFIYLGLHLHKYSREWVHSVQSEIREYKSMAGSREAKDARLEQLKFDILHYEENRSNERSRLFFDECVRDIRNLLSGRRVLPPQD